MSIHFRCSHCQQSFPVTTQLRGDLRRCPRCQEGTLSAEVAEKSQAKPAKPSRRTRPSTPVAEEQTTAPEHWGLILATCFSSIILGLGLLTLFLSRGRDTGDNVALADPQPVLAPAPDKLAPSPSNPPAREAELDMSVPPPPPPAAVEPAAEKAAPVEAKRGPLVIKRRLYVTEETLRRSLMLVPTTDLNDVPEKTRREVANAPKNRKYHYEEIPDYAGLSLRMGVDCQLGKDESETMQVLSRKMRVAMSKAVTPDDPRPSASALRRLLMIEGDQWLQREAVPTLTQMLMPESKALRMVMVELLRDISDVRATVALAQRAVFDLAPEVRAAALEALRDRPLDDFRAVFLEAFRYPWAPVADHAAEAVIALQDKASVPALLELLEAPDPREMFVDSKVGPARRDLVRINHLSNCSMCHASSMAVIDPVRGRIPSPSAPLPPPVQYYDAANGIFVRADVTYLRQDFSVPQPVAKSNHWPTNQRFDYMVRTRPLSTAELYADELQQGIRRGDTRAMGRMLQNNVQPDPILLSRPPAGRPNYAQRDAVLFSLRELTGKDAGKDSKNWQRLVAAQR